MNSSRFDSNEPMGAAMMARSQSIPATVSLYHTS